MIGLPRLMISAAILAAFHVQGSGQAGGVLGQKSQDSERLVVERLQRELRGVFKGFVPNIVVDLKTSEPVPRIEFSTSGTARIWSEEQFATLFGAMAHRTAIQVQDGIVLQRSTESIGSGNDYATVQWLSRLQSGEIQKLCGDGAAFRDLTPGTQQMLARSVHLPGLQQAMMSDQFVSVAMRVQLVINAQDSQGNPIEIPMNISARSSPKEADARGRTERAFKPGVAPVLDAKPPTGSLDFSAGQVVSLASFVDRASKAFHKNYIFDGRLADSTYYVQGRFSEAAFLKSAGKATEAIPVQEPDGQSEQRRKSMMKALLDKVMKLVDPSLAPKGMQYDDVLRGDKFSASDLVNADPGLQAGFQRNGIDPNAQFSISPRLRIDIVANSADSSSGQTPIGNDITIIFK